MHVAKHVLGPWEEIAKYVTRNVLPVVWLQRKGWAQGFPY